MKSVLNVGGSSRTIGIPGYFEGWKHDLLDIDASAEPDIVADARELKNLSGGTYDAIYCSHNLEHYHRHEGEAVLAGFHHMLKPDGFVEIRVPDLQAALRAAVMSNLDIDDVLYVSGAGPILVRDVIYGYHVEIEAKKNDYFAHKTGFYSKSLQNFVTRLGFPFNAVGTHHYEIIGYFFKQPPTIEQLTLLRLVPQL